MDLPVVIGTPPRLLVCLFILLTFTSTVVYTQSSFEDDIPLRKNHLSGIRPLKPTRRPRPVEPLPIDDSTYPQRSNVRRHHVTTINTVATGSFKNRLLSALKEALSDYDTLSNERTLYSDSSKAQVKPSHRVSHPVPEIVTPVLPSHRDNMTLHRPIPLTPSKVGAIASAEAPNTMVASSAEAITVSTILTHDDETIRHENSEEAKKR
ncbi:hypothetical protein Tcan_00082, partial [Toxocara canis]